MWRHHIDWVNSKQKRTLAAIFADPAPGNLAWSDIESLLIAIDCRVVEGSGSRVRFEKDGIVARFHRPHPKREARRYQVRDARQYLVKLGFEP